MAAPEAGALPNFNCILPAQQIETDWRCNSEESLLGSTGYQPVRSGNLPDGREAALINHSRARFVTTLAAIPVGKLPVPPIFQTGSQNPHRYTPPSAGAVRTLYG